MKAGPAAVPIAIEPCRIHNINSLAFALCVKLLILKKEIEDYDPCETPDVLEQCCCGLLRWLWHFRARVCFVETVIGRSNREASDVSRAENV